MKAVIKWLVSVAGFLFGNLLPLAAILIGAVFFILFFPRYAIPLTAVWAVVVIVIDVRYSRWY
ncbi:hypothetical protein HA48_10400 [Pantoea wallisii]|uniref:Uncharacterized protein n=1 Tax=Pantoea wallisii TaxID=1076551 RepID=A0A1X1D990_9GAMM|nr:hypothetical protein HA48_10400 [Pantoea wallisii]